MSILNNTKNYCFILGCTIAITTAITIAIELAHAASTSVIVTGMALTASSVAVAPIFPLLIALGAVVGAVLLFSLLLSGPYLFNASANTRCSTTYVTPACNRYGYASNVHTHPSNRYGYASNVHTHSGMFHHGNNPSVTAHPSQQHGHGHNHGHSHIHPR